jgi:hypothetical protein
MTNKSGTRKLSPTQQWVADHPNDVPPPRVGSLGWVAWRRQRGLDAAGAALRKRYEEAMVETRAARAVAAERDAAKP